MASQPDVFFNEAAAKGHQKFGQVQIRRVAINEV